MPAFLLSGPSKVQCSISIPSLPWSFTSCPHPINEIIIQSALNLSGSQIYIEYIHHAIYTKIQSSKRSWVLSRSALSCTLGFTVRFPSSSVSFSICNPAIYQSQTTLRSLDTICPSSWEFTNRYFFIVEGTSPTAQLALFAPHYCTNIRTLPLSCTIASSGIFCCVSAYSFWLSPVHISRSVKHFSKKATYDEHEPAKQWTLLPPLLHHTIWD